MKYFFECSHFLSSFSFSASSNKASLNPSTMFAVLLCAVSGLPIMKSQPVNNLQENAHSSSFSLSLLNREFSAILRASFRIVS